MQKSLGPRVASLCKLSFQAPHLYLVIFGEINCRSHHDPVISWGWDAPAPKRYSVTPQTAKQQQDPSKAVRVHNPSQFIGKNKASSLEMSSYISVEDGLLKVLNFLSELCSSKACMSTLIDNALLRCRQLEDLPGLELSMGSRRAIDIASIR